MRSPSVNAAFSLRRNRAALRRLVRRLARNRRGVAMVEFAFVLPLLLAMYAGAVEIGQGVMIDRKLTGLAKALGDLTAQTGLVTNDEMTNIFDAASIVMTPFTTVEPGMVVTSVVVDAAGVAKVCWSEAKKDPKLAPGSTVVLPNHVKIASTSVIMATASYQYEPLIGIAITGKIKINAGPFYMRPRLGKPGGKLNIEQVERAGSAMCPT